MGLKGQTEEDWYNKKIVRTKRVMAWGYNKYDRERLNDFIDVESQEEVNSRNKRQLEIRKKDEEEWIAKWIHTQRS